MKLVMTSPANSLATAAGQKSGSAKRLRTMFMSIGILGHRQIDQDALGREEILDALLHPSRQQRTKDESPCGLRTRAFHSLAL